MSSTTTTKEELEQELFDCVREGDFDRTSKLIELDGVSINCTCDDPYEHHGQTPLMFAIHRGHDQIARYLLESGADIEAGDEDGDTALVYASAASMTELLLEYGANVEATCHPFGTRNGSAYSPLAQAIYDTDVERVRVFLQFGANTKETLYKGKTYSALHIACRTSNMEIVQLLLDHDDGVDVNAFSPRDGDNPAMSPLCEVCRNDYLEVAQLLVQNGAQVIHEGGSYPDTPCPLKHAVDNGSLNLLQSLLGHSPHSSALVASERSTLAVVPTGGFFQHPLSVPLKAALLTKSKLPAAQLLVDHGANVNDGPFLCLCANVGNVNGARMLLRSGADVNQVTTAGETPLWIAANNGNIDLVKELLKAHADVNIRNIGGETPLGIAFRNGHKGVVYLLLRTSPHVWLKLKDSW